MYRHLMVPLDDSALSAETAGKAVRLARTLGAKVTFFHAQEDYGATSIGALQTRDGARRLQRGHGRGSAGDPGQGGSRRARGRRQPRIVRDDEQPALRGDSRCRREAAVAT